METATLFVVGWHNRVPTGALLLVSDLPMVPEGVAYRQVSRTGSGSPATGSHAIHVQEQKQIIDETFEGL